VGHARGAVVFDVLYRYLGFKGFEVAYVRNITDVDDKIIDRTRQETGLEGDLKARVKAVADRYTERFQTDFARLGLLKPTLEPKATEFIPQMISLIQRLLDRGMAYVGSDGVYFSVRKIPSYGKLSHQSLNQLLAGTRVSAAGGEPADGKRDPLDFALWKKGKSDEPHWDSPWGAGRPGWHIECSTMSTHLLGDSFDIHGGGQDLIFPHHENEIAQAQGAGKPFARIWLHNGLLTFNGQKMAKSIGNIVTIQQALERHSAQVLRLFFLAAHYRSPIDFTWERLEESAHAYERLTTALDHADRLNDRPRVENPLIQKQEELFHSAMEDDLNTPAALASLYRLATSIHEWLRCPDKQVHVPPAAKKLSQLGHLLGFFQKRDSLGSQIEQFIAQRDQARQRKDYATADAIRRKLVDMGYIVEDTDGRTVVRKRV